LRWIDVAERDASEGDTLDPSFGFSLNTNDVNPLSDVCSITGLLVTGKRSVALDLLQLVYRQKKSQLSSIYRLPGCTSIGTVHSRKARGKRALADSLKCDIHITFVAAPLAYRSKLRAARARIGEQIRLSRFDFTYMLFTRRITK
jgi:hypothetical protein